MIAFIHMAKILLKIAFSFDRCRYCFKEIHKDEFGIWCHGWSEWKTCHPNRPVADLPEEFAAPMP